MASPNANPDKRRVDGKVQRQNSRRFRVETADSGEVDIDLEILEDGNYQVEKLESGHLPKSMPNGDAIHWFNNFSIKKNGSYINQRYRVKIPGIYRMAPSRLVILNGSGDLYYYEGTIEPDDSFELTDGDPAVGGSPP